MERHHVVVTSNLRIGRLSVPPPRAYPPPPHERTPPPVVPTPSQREIALTTPNLSPEEDLNNGAITSAAAAMPNKRKIYNRTHYVKRTAAKSTTTTNTTTTTTLTTTTITTTATAIKGDWLRRADGTARWSSNAKKMAKMHRVKPAVNQIKTLGASMTRQLLSAPLLTIKILQLLVKLPASTHQRTLLLSPLNMSVSSLLRCWDGLVTMRKLVGRHLARSKMPPR
jgi:hypothetical protein